MQVKGSKRNTFEKQSLLIYYSHRKSDGKSVFLLVLTNLTASYRVTDVVKFASITILLNANKFGMQKQN